jgi:transcription initiation factor TFIIH subunit 2
MPGTVKGISVSSRYECTVCENHFCIDCDVFAHEVVHNCPGCQSKNPHVNQAPEAGMNGTFNGYSGPDEMDVG